MGAGAYPGHESFGQTFTQHKRRGTGLQSKVADLQSMVKFDVARVLSRPEQVGDIQWYINLHIRQCPASGIDKLLWSDHKFQEQGRGGLL